MASVVEVQVESQVDAGYVRWLYEQLREVDRVAAPDGTCEAIGFGAVNPLPGGLVLPWGEFADNPVGSLAPMMRRGCRELAPVVLAEYQPGDDTVRFRWGRHMPASRAPRGAVVLG